MAAHVFGITAIPLKHKEITRLLHAGNTVWIGQRNNLLYQLILPPHDSGGSRVENTLPRQTVADKPLPPVADDDDDAIRREVEAKTVALTVRRPG